jgi:hypothetical protein
LSINSAEAKAWRSNPKSEGYTHPLAKAQKLAREAAREDYRAGVARKRAEAASLHVDLPSHISRPAERKIDADILRDIEKAVDGLRQQLLNKYPDVNADHIDAHIAKCVKAERIRWAIWGGGSARLAAKVASAAVSDEQTPHRRSNRCNR